jgi:hypothetical protein
MLLDFGNRDLFLQGLTGIYDVGHVFGGFVTL